MTQARGALAAVLGTAALVTLAYQWPVVYAERVGDGVGRGYAEGLGAAGTTRGLRWRWIGAASRVVFPGAGQIVPKARLRVRLGIPAEAGSRPRRVFLALAGERLADVEATAAWAVSELPVDAARAGSGDWVLTIGAESLPDADGIPRTAALVRAELVSEPPLLPPGRTVVLAVVAVLALQSLLEARLRRTAALAVALAAAAAAAVGLAFFRELMVVVLDPFVVALLLAALVDRARGGAAAARFLAWLGGRTGSWVGAAMAPGLALGGLVFVSLGGSPGVGVAASVVGAGVWLVHARGARPAASRTVESRPRVEVVLVAGVIVLAFAFRLYRLEEVPFAIFRDEARHGILALRLLADPNYRPLFLGPPISHPIPYFLAIAASFEAFGVSLFSLRLVSAVAGAAAVPLLWLLVREVVGPREGLLAAFGLALSSWHVSISRFALNYVEPTLFSLPAYFLLWRALRRGRLAEAILAGLLVALGQYAAHTAKALLVVSVGLVADEAISRFRRGDGAGLRRVVRGASAAAALAILGLVPLLRFLHEDPEAYLARLRQVSILSQSRGQDAAILLAHNLATYAGAFHVSGDLNGRHHLPGAPLLDPVSGLGFLAGLGVVLTGLGSRAHRFLLLWLVAGLLPGLLTFEAPSALRTVEAAPAAYAIAALGVVALWRQRPQGPTWVWRILAAAAVVACVAWNGWTYFVRMYESPTVWGRFAAIGTQVGKRLDRMRLEGTLPEKILLQVPRSFFDDADNRYVLAFLCPTGLKLAVYDDDPPSEVRGDAMLFPNDRDFWRLVSAHEPRYAPLAAKALKDEERWRSRLGPALSRPALAGPPFPGTDRPTFWLYLLR